ncbi:MAG: glycosyltransferase [Lutibacter sp.]|nr:glycosyltransferase [Lutibacter sp.]
MPIKIAILLAVYNGEKWLVEQIESILHQAYVVQTIFISLDLSDDDSLVLCKKLAKQYSNIQLLPYGERFGGAGKNFYRLIHDVDFSGFDYVALSDQDDIWLPNKLSHAVAMMQAHSADVVSSDVLAFWEDGREKLVKKSYPQKSFDYFFEAAGPGCTYVFKASVLQDFQAFLQQRWLQVNQVDLHDWMLYAYCRSKGYQWHIDNKPLMRYRQHANNQVGFNSGFKAYKKRLQLVRSHWYRNEVTKIVTLVDPQGKSGFRLNRWFLIRYFWQLRRRPRDAFALLVMIILNLY